MVRGHRGDHGELQAEEQEKTIHSPVDRTVNIALAVQSHATVVVLHGWHVHRSIHCCLTKLLTFCYHILQQPTCAKQPFLQ